MSLTYRGAVRGLFGEEWRGLELNGSDVHAKTRCVSSLKVTNDNISKDSPNVVNTDMIAEESGGG